MHKQGILQEPPAIHALECTLVRLRRCYRYQI